MKRVLAAFLGAALVYLGATAGSWLLVVLYNHATDSRAVPTSLGLGGLLAAGLVAVLADRQRREQMDAGAFRRVLGHVALVNALLLPAFAFAVLRMGDERSQSAALRADVVGYMTDVMVGLCLVLPTAAAITWALFRYYREQTTLANVVTVFSGVFGVLACFYFLWTLRY